MMSWRLVATFYGQTLPASAKCHCAQSGTTVQRCPDKDLIVHYAEVSGRSRDEITTTSRSVSRQRNRLGSWRNVCRLACLVIHAPPSCMFIISAPNGLLHSNFLVVGFLKSNREDFSLFAWLNLHGLLPGAQPTNPPRDEVNPDVNVAKLGEVFAIEVASN
jgi:hypothetical protein